MNVMVGIFKRIFLGSIVFLLPLFLVSCAWLESFESPDTNPNQPPVLEPTKFKILLIDTPRVKFYDFVSFKHNKTNKKFNLELYKLGKPVGEIVITPKEVCIAKQCSAKWIAVKSFFGEVSYPNLFSDILAARDIFDGEGKRVSNDGTLFVQWFVRGGQEFYYERSKNKVLFKNLSANITIGIEDYIPPSNSTN